MSASKTKPAVSKQRHWYWRSQNENLLRASIKTKCNRFDLDYNADKALYSTKVQKSITYRYDTGPKAAEQKCSVDTQTNLLLTRIRFCLDWGENI